MRAPQAFQASSTRCTDSGRFSASGVSTTRPTGGTWPAGRGGRGNEPPIKPTPMTARRTLLLQAGRERGEELLVFLGDADRHAQVLGQLVGAAHRTHDDAAA